MGAQALGELAGLQKLEVSQCNGVTEEGLLEGMPCWPALTHLHLDCLRFTTESVCTLVQVSPSTILPNPSHMHIAKQVGFCQQIWVASMLFRSSTLWCYARFAAVRKVNKR